MLATQYKRAFRLIPSIKREFSSVTDLQPTPPKFITTAELNKMNNNDLLYKYDKMYEINIIQQREINDLFLRIEYLNQEVEVLQNAIKNHKLINNDS